MDIEQKIYYGSLYDIYYELLTKRQQNIFELFFEEDYTVSEIANIEKVSSALVSKTLSEIKKKLLFFEKSLKIYENYNFNIALLTDSNVKQDIIQKIK